MKVERIDMVDVDVKNLDEAERLFSDLLGITFERMPLGEQSSKVLTGHADKGSEELQLKIATSPIGLDLIESVPPLEREGLRAINLKVTDIEQAKAEMKSKGIRLLAEEAVGGFKEAIYNPEDLHGVRLCLLEYTGPSRMSAMLEK